MKKDIMLSLLLLFLVLLPLSAHKPLFDAKNKDNVVTISNPGISQVVYHDVETDGDRIWLKFSGEKDDEVYISIGVPVIGRLSGFRPAVALLGRGLPPLEDLPVDLPIKTGYFFPTTGTGHPRYFHEPFTDTASWILLEQRVRLPQTGTYYVLGITGDTQTEKQKFWVSIGEKENFGLCDLFSFFDWKRRVRDFHEADSNDIDTEDAEKFYKKP
ncbi:MAG: hypothetical protein JW881_00345 [Spirochaetales bacterium]|nr:hypothetical protein [Spirochaetales bacterium]